MATEEFCFNNTDAGTEAHDEFGKPLTEDAFPARGCSPSEVAGPEVKGDLAEPRMSTTT